MTELAPLYSGAKRLNKPTTEVTPEGFKRCTECDDLKPLSEFHKLRSNAKKVGLRSVCKQCALHIRQGYKKSVTWRSRTAKRCMRCRQVKDIATGFASSRKVNCLECNKSATDRRFVRRLLYKFKITYEQYLAAPIHGKDSCDICGASAPAHKSLAIDHCHKTGRIRGLLCDACNTGIGFLGDDEERILKAYEYIRNSRLRCEESL